MTGQPLDPMRERLAAALQHQYRIEEEIGRGGMSVVYRARDLRLGRVVAIKALPPELAHDPAVRSRFTREAQTSAQLAHAHIVPIFDVGDLDGIAFFVMALVGGGNLAQRLADRPLRAVDEVRRLLCETADALAYAHLRGVIHRDVKPDNILIDADSERAVVTDFGIARAMESGTRLTQTGVAVGTPTYMSPEQAVGDRELDGRSDIYSLGVVGYQMLTGRPPFQAANSMALLLKHVSERPQPIADLRPEAPAHLCDAIERALRKEREERWPTASAFREALLGNAEPSRRSEPHREPIRYVSPVPRSRRDPALVRSASPALAASNVAWSTTGAIELVPPHLAALTVEQRADLRLWHGRIDLLDRVKSIRRYALLTTGAWILGITGFAFGVGEAPPLVLSPIVPIVMTTRLWMRGHSLRAAGLMLRRVFFSRRSRHALGDVAARSPRQLRKLASRAVLEGAYGSAIRRAVEERALILASVRRLSKADRAMLPDVAPTVRKLVERVAALAKRLHQLDTEFDARAMATLDARIATTERDAESTDELRHLALLRRQRVALEHAGRQRETLRRQLDNAGLALTNLRLDLIELQSSGIGAGLGEVTSATQDARMLSKEIGMALESVMEVRKL
ncbi:MAG TPA: serine/threonine-protein kinase [Gemmatimonadaceae bacterium]|jgi:serine/threonine-protein kinase|nr:serine/threonine-protein kinase [Gemmatimonadaceae bacterium]